MLKPLVVEEKGVARAALIRGGGEQLTKRCCCWLYSSEEELVVVVVSVEYGRCCKLKVDVGADTTTVEGTAEPC